MWELPLFPEEASTTAGGVDALFIFLCAVSIFFSLLIVILLLVFVVKYRRRSDDERPEPILGNLRLELLWTIVPFILVMVMFGWGASLFMQNATAPPDAEEIYVVGKQWMWKIQHLNGPREINELHVPVGRPVKLIMTSEDVLHDFFVPAFRTKRDVVPGRYTTQWFEATKTGSYHLFCAEYCGTGHSVMIGKVVVMEPYAYQDWLSGGSTGETLPEAGEKLFNRLGCVTCHTETATARGATLTGLFGSIVHFKGGGTLKADEAYIRESILEPNKRIVQGYEPMMPTYKGQLSEEDIIKIIAYLKTLTAPGGQKK